MREHLTYASLLRQSRDVSVDNKMKLVDDILALLSLEHIQDAQIKVLSGGEQRRCSIGAELLASPLFLLLDEPLSGLDSAIAAQLLIALRRLANGADVMATTSPNMNHKAGSCICGGSSRAQIARMGILM